MLKIKDNVDLKELEKYGFDGFSKLENDHYCIQDNDDWFPSGLIIDMETKEILLLNGEYDIPIKQFTGKHTTILYDLIKDGLVEKVEE